MLFQFIFRKKLREMRELEEKHKSLIDKCSELLKEKSELADKLQKYEGWEKNPFLLLKNLLPELTFLETLGDINKYGKRVPLEFNYNNLSKEDRHAHLLDIDRIHRSGAFQAEMDAMWKDMSRQIILESESGESNTMLRQLLVFVLGIKKRFEMLSNIFIQEQKSDKPTDPHHPIGQ